MTTMKFGGAALLALVLSAGACSSSDDKHPCDKACNKLDGCGLAVFVDGEQLSVNQCIAGCKDDPQGSQQASCVNKVSGCNEEALSACL